MAPVNKLSWKFPLKNFIFLKIETFFVVILAIVVFLLSFQKGWFYAVVATIIFLGVYILVSFVVQKIRKVEEQYHLTTTHLQVTRKTRNTLQKDKVPLKDIKSHKLSKKFLGGYLLTHKKKHLLFFNSRDELDKFDNHLQKHYKSRNKKKVVKKRVAKKVVKKKPATKKRPVRRKR
tara:strand:+ start:837 stop:1364 length:528 start_codon:yes stop_codon:yes gene_type:complete